MSNLICKKDFNPCRTPGMCAPHGGCPGSEVDAGRNLLAENDRLFKLLERLVTQMLPVEELKDLPGYSRVLTAEALLIERDQLKAENEALRKRIEDLSPLKSAPLFGPDTKCLACGGYHYGVSGLPCPNMRVTAQTDLPETRSGQIGYGMEEGGQ